MNQAMKSAALIFGLLLLANSTNAQSPREQFQQMVEQLQKNSSDDALREKIINLAQEIKPPPAVPEEARRYFIEGTTIAGTAKNAKQQALAVESFNSALKIAPWWGDAYYNLAVALELAGQFDDAKRSTRLYILSNPGDKETREAQDRIYALDAKKKLTEQEDNFEGFWVIGEWKHADKWLRAEGIPAVYNIKKHNNGTYVIEFPIDERRHYRSWFEEIRVNGHVIKWFQGLTCENNISPCGDRVSCRRTGEETMECIYEKVGYSVPNYPRITEALLHRYKHCERESFHEEAILWIMRCE